MRLAGDRDMKAELSIEERLARLEARADLADLVNRYGLALDDRDWKAIGGCFTEDAALRFTGGEVSGREAIVAFYAEQLPKNEFTFHYPHSAVFDFHEPGRATGIVTAHAEHARNGTCVLAAVRYLDEYVQEAGTWRLAAREIRSRYCLGWLELAGDYRSGALTDLMRG